MSRVRRHRGVDLSNAGLGHNDPSLLQFACDEIHPEQRMVLGMDQLSFNDLYFLTEGPQDGGNRWPSCQQRETASLAVKSGTRDSGKTWTVACVCIPFTRCRAVQQPAEQGTEQAGPLHFQTVPQEMASGEAHLRFPSKRPISILGMVESRRKDRPYQSAYACLSGITPRTPPLGCGMSPSRRGIRCMWACMMVCPALVPQFTPMLKPVTVRSDASIRSRRTRIRRSASFFSAGVIEKKSGM